MIMEEITEKEELYLETGFCVQNELETLKAMLNIAENFYNGNLQPLPETREAVKKSVKELCSLFCKFVDCL